MSPAAPPYYESRFIRANNPMRPQALWLRETLLLPRSPVGKREPANGAHNAQSRSASADVWLMVFDPAGDGQRALRMSYPIDDGDLRDEPWTARIAATTLDDQSAAGAIDAGNGSARWNLAIHPGGEPPVKLLTDRGYNAPFPTAKTMVRHPLARFDGTVELAGSSVVVDGWTGSVNHNWGRKHTHAYAFGQVCGFDHAPEATLEIVTARAGIGPVLLPSVTLLVLRYGGREFAVRSVLGPRRISGRYEPFSWTFGGKVGGLTLRGEMRAEPADVIGLTYTDTDGGSKYCYNSAVATCRVRLSGTDTAQLAAERRAMFEILTDTRHQQVPLLV
jgi:hypothetical protein